MLYYDQLYILYCTVDIRRTTHIEKFYKPDRPVQFPTRLFLPAVGSCTEELINIVVNITVTIFASQLVKSFALRLKANNRHCGLG